MNDEGKENKIKKLLKFNEDKDLTIFDDLQELDSKVDKVEASLIKRIDGVIESINAVSENLKKKLESELVLEIDRDELKGEQGDKGEIGEKGEQGELGPKGERGEPGLKGDRGENGKDGANGADGSPDTPAEVRDKLESLYGDDRLTIDSIKDLREKIDEVRKLAIRPVGGGIVGRDLFKDVDISASLNGVTKTFNIAAVWNILTVNLSSFPYGSLRKNIDYTWTPTSITFTSTIDAPTQLAAGQSCILTVVTG